MFAEMRRTNPVAHVAMMNRESYVVTRYDDVWTVLRDGDTYSSRANAEVGKFMGRTIIEMDGKEHARHRALISSIFTAKAIDALQPVIESLAHERIAAFASAGRADLVRDLTTIFPVQVIAHIVGVPPTDYASFMRWSLDLIAFSKDPQRGRDAARTLHDYLLPIVQRRRAEPCGDVISKLVTGTVDGVGLTDDEVISFLRLLMPAGAETTSRLMGSMFFALLVERESCFARVHADRALVPWAIEETLAGRRRSSSSPARRRGRRSSAASTSPSAWSSRPSSPPATATSRTTRSPTASTSTGTPTTTCRSASPVTSASATTWRRWKRARRSAPCSTGYPRYGSIPTRTRPVSPASPSARRSRYRSGSRVSSRRRAPA
jgi:hypothetical protein